jgi:hypothetical protein
MSEVPENFEELKAMGYNYTIVDTVANGAALGSDATVALAANHYFIGEKMTFLFSTGDDLGATSLVISTPNNATLFDGGASVAGMELAAWCDEVFVIMDDAVPASSVASNVVLLGVKYLTPEIQIDASNVFKIVGVGNYTQDAPNHDFYVAIHGAMIPSQYFTDASH